MSRKLLRPLLAMLAVLPGSDTEAHKHVGPGGPVSWYPHECCHDGDCRPVVKVVRAPQGLWMTTADGQTVLVGPGNRRLPSRDLRWHVCINNDIEAVPDTIRCVFEPPDT